MVIECCRAGAIGDVLMTTPALRAVRKKCPTAYIRYVTINPDLLINNADIDDLSFVSESCDIQFLFEYPLEKSYPDVPLEKHLAYEFADRCGVEIDSVRGTLSFPERELRHVRSIIGKFDVPTAKIHINSGCSPYKEWPVENWQKVVDHFFGRIAFIQIGGKNEPVLNRVASLVGLLNIRLSAACIHKTDMFVGVDSFSNHGAAPLAKSRGGWTNFSKTCSNG